MIVQAGNMELKRNMSPVSTTTTPTTTTTPSTATTSARVKLTKAENPTKTTTKTTTTTALPHINPFKRPMNTLQKQWYRVLIARRVGYGSPRRQADDNKEQSYQSVCQQRYKAASRRYNEQFMKEIRQLEAMQPSAIDAMRVHRTFAITTLWLPLHSRREINLTLEKLETVLSVKERRRLEEILKYGPSAKRY